MQEEHEVYSIKDTSEFAKLVDKVVGERSANYDGPEQSFERIGMMWSAYLLHNHKYRETGIVEPADVALMMTLLKVCRVMNKLDKSTLDSVVDIGGYAKCLYEIVTR
jgi:hypothetical protein